MADIKISELGSAASVNDTDVIPMTASGVTVKATAALLKNYMGVGSLSSLTTDDKTSLVNAINEVDGHTDATQQMIAPVLTTPVAPAGGLANGDQFVYNGLLYKATAAIAGGGTITIDGNCELADSVTEQLKSEDNRLSILEKGKGELISNTDLNTLLETGQYRLYQYNVNLPISAEGLLVVLNSFNVSNSFAVQLFFTNVEQYLRFYNYGVWTAWRQF